MTKSFKPIYQPDDPRNPIIKVGVEIATRAMEEYQQFDGSSYLVPIKTLIVFLTIPSSMYSHEEIHKLLAAKGYPRSLWCIHAVWECVDDTNIF